MNIHFNGSAQPLSTPQFGAKRKGKGGTRHAENPPQFKKSQLRNNKPGDVVQFNNRKGNWQLIVDRKVQGGHRWASTWKPITKKQFNIKFSGMTDSTKRAWEALQASIYPLNEGAEVPTDAETTLAVMEMSDSMDAEIIDRVLKEEKENIRFQLREKASEISRAFGDILYPIDVWIDNPDIELYNIFKRGYDDAREMIRDGGLTIDDEFYPAAIGEQELFTLMEISYEILDDPYMDYKRSKAIASSHSLGNDALSNKLDNEIQKIWQKEFGQPVRALTDGLIIGLISNYSADEARELLNKLTTKDTPFLFSNITDSLMARVILGQPKELRDALFEKHPHLKETAKKNRWLF